MHVREGCRYDSLVYSVDSNLGPNFILLLLRCFLLKSRFAIPFRLNLSPAV